MIQKKTYKGIDIFKAIAAILVVVLHTIETTDYFACGIKFVLTRFAVPFFFIASGFFFARGLDTASDKRAYFNRYEKHLLRIFVIWGIVIYGPFTITSYIYNNISEGWIKIIGLLIRRMFVIGAGPYWYLVALFWSIFFIYCCHIKKKDWLLKTGIIFGIVLSILYSSFRSALSEITFFEFLFEAIYFIYSWEFNFFMYGIPFAGLGYYIYSKQIRIDYKISGIIFILATFGRVLEYCLPVVFPLEPFWQNNNISVFYIIQAIAYFLIAKEIDINRTSIKTKMIRKWSSFVYFTHVIILYNIINPLLKNLITIDLYAPRFIILKALIVLIVCTFLFLLINKSNNKYLKILTDE